MEKSVNKYGGWALVTGSSQGIGKGMLSVFVEQLGQD